MDPDLTLPRDAAAPPSLDDPRELYLDLLKKCLTRSIFPESYQTIAPLRGGWKRALYTLHLPLKKALGSAGVELVRRVEYDPKTRAEGLDHPPEADTMVGLDRLDNVQDCVVDVLERGVPGDLIETGVWRGGVTIFMRAILKAYGVTDRVVWVADSFEGLPPPDRERFPEEPDEPFWLNPHLAVSLEQVQGNFGRYGLLDDQVRFLPGWFRDTLPEAPVERLAILRLDGDMYESTMVALDALYPKLERGGYVIVDDYGGGAIGATKAVDEFRSRHGIAEELVRLGWSGAYWQRAKS
jgi:O-methyltransferase